MVLAMDRALVPSIGRGLRRDQFGDADQIVGDQVEQEIGSNGGDAPDGVAAPSGTRANSHDRCRYALGHVICADADALQARPQSNRR